MTYKNGERFALNHHAGFITLKETGVVRLEFFALFFQNLLRNLSVSDGSKTLSLAQLYSVDFEIPDYDLQCRILEKILPLKHQIDSLSTLQQKYTNLLNRQIGATYKEYQATEVPISKAIECMSGNSGLTEEFIYSTTQIQGQRYKVLSSATDENTMMGEVPKCMLKGKTLKVFEDKEGLLVTRNGKAGETVFLEAGKYTINDHAYILYKKRNYPYNINLKWLAIQYKSDILSYSSASDNGTWNKTGFFNNTIIDIPELSEQLKIVQLYDKVQAYVNRIEFSKMEYEKVLSKEVV
jgi:restriction endonuclease S subunit